jgi:hypothetical protein
MDWRPIPEETIPRRIYEVKGATDEPIEIYRERYTSPLPAHYMDKVMRYYLGVITHMDPGSSVLVFGSGHPLFMNDLKNQSKNIDKYGCVDFIEEAGIGLDKCINFYNNNILEEDLPDGYDYVFSSHTLEHFTRDELMELVVPRMLMAADKAVIAVVPYASAWSGEPSHKCRFNEYDELAALASRYKVMLDGKELVLWFDLGG